MSKHRNIRSDEPIIVPDPIERLERLHQRLLRVASESQYTKITLHFEAGMLVRVTQETSEHVSDSVTPSSGTLWSKR